MRARRQKAATKEQIRNLNKSGVKTLMCKNDDCNNLIKRASVDAHSAICWLCTYKMAPYAPTEKSSPEDNLPRGWHRRRLFKSSSGKFYSYGKEVTAKEAGKISAEIKDKPANTRPAEKRPRGWHKKQLYTSPSGIVYRYGVEVKK